MVRTPDPDPDVDVESFTTDRLAAYINDTAPVAADLPDDAPAAAQITANVEAAIAEFKARKSPDAVTDGGQTPGDVYDGDWVDHLEDEDKTHKVRHDQAIRTHVVDGVAVHEVVEEYDRDADAESLSFTGGVRCPCDDHDVDKEYGDDSSVVRYKCDADGCPFEATVIYRDADVTDRTPASYRVVVPVAGVVDRLDTDADEMVDDVDADAADVANIARRLMLTRFVGGVNDKAHVSAEYDGDVTDDAEKVADAYIDDFECARCGDTHDAGAEYTHPAFDDAVCAACEDVPVWSVDDADLPDDVEAAFDDFASVTPAKFRDLLRDVIHFPAWVAANDDDTDVDDAPACPTGSQGERKTRGVSKKGTGLRRPDGVAHGDANWRVVLREARDAGLVERVDDEDVDFDAPGARWSATDKGRAVFDELATCEWCGGDLCAYSNTYTVKLSRWNATENTDLSLACPDGCDGGLRGSTVDLSDDV